MLCNNVIIYVNINNNLVLFYRICHFSGILNAILLNETTFDYNLRELVVFNAYYYLFPHIILIN